MLKGEVFKLYLSQPKNMKRLSAETDGISRSGEDFFEIELVCRWSSFSAGEGHVNDMYLWNL